MTHVPFRTTEIIALGDLASGVVVVLILSEQRLLLLLLFNKSLNYIYIIFRKEEKTIHK